RRRRDLRRAPRSASIRSLSGSRAVRRAASRRTPHSSRGSGAWKSGGEPDRGPGGPAQVKAFYMWPILGLPLLLLAGMLTWLGSYPLFQPDEGRNAEVAREMVASGDYLVPRLDDVVYVDKPV